jgi:hypothetical protein
MKTALKKIMFYSLFKANAASMVLLLKLKFQIVSIFKKGIVAA